MVKENSHNNMIKSLCREILIPYGIFEKGTSRVYIDDNGYFFTVIEFQPLSWAKGTSLNVALNFLWRNNEYITYDFSADGNTQIAKFVEYQTDEQFEREVRSYVEIALEKALFYRSFRDIGIAEQYFKKDYTQVKKSLPLFYLNENELPENINLQLLLQKSDIRKNIKEQRNYWRTKPSMKKVGYSEYDD